MRVWISRWQQDRLYRGFVTWKKFSANSREDLLLAEIEEYKKQIAMLTKYKLEQESYSRKMQQTSIKKMLNRRAHAAFLQWRDHAKSKIKAG